MSQRLKARLREVGADQTREELIASTARLRLTGERSELASELRDLAELERWRSDHPASIGYYEEVVAVLRGLDEPLRLGHALRHLGQVQQEHGDIDQAGACYTEALALYREFGAAEPLQLANSVRYLAVAKHETGEAKAAASLWQEACDRYEALELPAGVAESAARLAMLSSQQGESDDAIEWLGRAQAAAQASRDPETIDYVNGVSEKLG